MDKTSHACIVDDRIATAAADAEREFVIRHAGGVYAGRHLLLDLWDGEGLDDAAHIDCALRRSVEAAGATLLHIHLHEFTENGGVSGVAVLAESHISIHTWPEWNYAALDVFMCGDTDPLKASEMLREAFKPGRMEVSDHHRGRIR